FAAAFVSCWLIATAFSLQLMVMVQLGGAPALAGQSMLALAFGSRPVTLVLHRARSKAASGSATHGAPKHTSFGTVAMSAIACVWVLSGVAGAMTRQRVQAPLTVESCRVMVVVTNPAAVLAKPSRLYVIAVTLLVALKVSGTWPLNAPCTRSTVSPASTVAFAFGSENTIQPFAQAVPPVQPVPSAET